MTTSPITSISDELLAELEQEARNATPGPWTADASPVGEMYVSGACDEFICGAVDHVHDANLIALANPATILALLAERAELKRDAERLEWIVDQVAMVHTYPGRDGASYCVYWPDSESEQAYTHATPREAIDQAMKEAKP